MLKHPIILGVAAVLVIVGVATGKSLVLALAAAAFAYGILRVGVMMLGGLARPVPEPPPPGELRKVRLLYRCSICGTEVRMTAANDEDPEPPRHCLEDMDLVAPTVE
jgi:hypothetical protein